MCCAVAFNLVAFGIMVFPPCLYEVHCEILNIFYFSLSCYLLLFPVVSGKKMHGKNLGFCFGLL